MEIYIEKLIYKVIDFIEANKILKQPDIILIMTDQQRAFSINALRTPWMKTPTLIG